MSDLPELLRAIAAGSDAQVSKHACDIQRGGLDQNGSSTNSLKAIRTGHTQRRYL